MQEDVEGAVIALHDAAHHGHAECVQRLVAPSLPGCRFPSGCQFPVNVNAPLPGSSTSPLHRAVSSAKSVRAVQILISYGASCTMQGFSGRTALHHACSSADREPTRCKIVLALLGAPHGMDVIDYPDCDGRTPLSLAAFYGLDRCCEVLLSAGSQAL